MCMDSKAGAMMGSDADGADATLAEERLVHEEYKVWKKNTPFLYDVIITKALEWPSLTAQWLPDRREPPGAPFAVHKLLLGTHTSAGVPNYLTLADVRVPSAAAAADVAQYAAEHAANPLPSSSAAGGGGGGGGGASAGDGGVGGYGAGPASKIEIVQEIPHDGEVNRARYMPQNAFLVATKTVSSDVLLFDTSKHPSKPPADGRAAPQARLSGHTKEGYGLSWSLQQPGALASAADDGLVVTWDVGANGSATVGGGRGGRPAKLNPTATYAAHDGVVEDVAWHNHHAHLLASVGDDRRLLVWDTRSPSRAPAPSSRSGAHKAEINSVAFNPFSEFVLATGSADHSVALWDLRSMRAKVHSCDWHTDEVLTVAWSPFHEAVLASAGADRRVNVWNLACIGEEQEKEDAEDGPPELMFIHGGHTGKLSDLAWSGTDAWLLASVAEDNMVQTWSVAEELVDAVDGGEDDEEGGEPLQGATPAGGAGGVVGKAGGLPGAANAPLRDEDLE
ncbi:hypothetical protein I4F81_011923 [Pyropia yezoensis]|uniref:Uncharacterized protein n=1 Tax=Pyropia yezoensis TaxID=2788 RepID=A0ACC3CGZ8_PYRYE|nr:hypothetical protein I4F81_011923 [Neopyropia yezoensis]